MIRNGGGIHCVDTRRTVFRAAARAVETLESRQLFSSSMLPAHTLTPTFINRGPIAEAHAALAPAATPAIAAPFSPGQVRTAYAINAIAFGITNGNGSGETIAIIDAYNDPTILSDAATFSSDYGLQSFNVSGGPTLRVLGQNGSPSLPSNAAVGGWDVEISLDVEWAHAVAPDANIVLFEANSNSSNDLYTAAKTAANYSGVSVVSMSFGSSEYAGESTTDSTFVTPNGHQGVTFLASAGDSGSGAEYPSASPEVVSVGGTSLTINSDGTYGGEIAWSGSGGGLSEYESQPGYQSAKVNGVSSAARATPDVSMLADPNTGVYVLDTYDNSAYMQVGGTSLACPMVAGLIAIADQGRALQGLGTLNGATQTLQSLYALPASNYHDITSGNNGLPAGAGYDLDTGLGTPAAAQFVPALAGYAAPAATATHLAYTQQPTSAAAGAAISPSVTVAVETASGAAVTGDSSSITLSIMTGPIGGTLTGSATEPAMNGVATFNALSFNRAGTYTLAAVDGPLTSSISSSFTISPAAAAAVVFVQQPTSTSTNITISPAVTVAVQDAYGNVVTDDTSSISLAVASGPGGASLSGAARATVVSGIATFSNLALAAAGTYTLRATDSTISSSTSGSFSIAARGGSVSGAVRVGSIGVAGVSVYLDGNDNGSLDSAELRTTTSSTGSYSFSNVPAGAYIFRQVLPSGYHQVTPTTNYGNHVATSNGSTSTNQNFVDAANTIAGLVKTPAGAALANATVYLDANNNGALDAGELRATTNASGAYTLSAVPVGSWTIRQIAPAGYAQTTPTGGIGAALTSSSYAITGKNFTDAANTASISGAVFNDVNRDGKRESTESGLGGWIVYIDRNDTGSYTPGDPHTTTDSSGNYHLTKLAAGNYIIRVVRPSKYRQTLPTNNYGDHVTLVTGHAVTGELFGEVLI